MFNKTSFNSSKDSIVLLTFISCPVSKATAYTVPSSIVDRYALIPIANSIVSILSSVVLLALLQSTESLYSDWLIVYCLPSSLQYLLLVTSVSLPTMCTENDNRTSSLPPGITTCLPVAFATASRLSNSAGSAAKSIGFTYPVVPSLRDNREPSNTLTTTL